MELLKPALWKQAQQFIKDCTGKKTHILHDYDEDGIGAGLTMLKTLKRLGSNATASTVKGRGFSIQAGVLEAIKKNVKPERIIIIDQDLKSFSSYEDYKRIFADTATMIIDHHHLQEYENILFVHPKLLFDVDGADYCTAMLTHNLCKELVELEDYAWMAAVGVIGDMNARHFPEFIKEVAEHEGVELPENPFDSKIGDINTALACCLAIGDQALQPYLNKLKQCKTLKDALALGNPHPEVIQEVEERAAQAEEMIGEGRGPYWIYGEPKYGTTGWAANTVSQKHRDKIFIFYREEGEGYAMSSRYQEAAKAGVHLGETLRDVGKEYGAKAGGHAPAGGGWVPKEHFEDFKKEVTQKLQE